MVKRLTDIRSAARAHTGMGIRVLAGIARNKLAQDSNRIAAIVELFNRGWGRAVQHVEQTGEVKQLIEVRLNVVSPRLAGDDVLELEANDIKSLEDKSA